MHLLGLSGELEIFATPNIAQTPWCYKNKGSKPLQALVHQNTFT